MISSAPKNSPLGDYLSDLLAGKLIWNLKITHVQRKKMIFQTFTIMFHVDFSVVYPSQGSHPIIRLIQKKKQPLLWLQPVCRFSTSSLRPSTNSSPQIWAGPIHNYLLLVSRDSWRVDGSMVAWFIYLHEWLILCGFHVGKYTIGLFLVYVGVLSSLQPFVSVSY